MSEVLRNFLKQFKSGRNSCLEDNRNKFMSHIKQTIENNGNISDEAKRAFLVLPAPQIELSSSSIKVGEIFKDHIKKKKFWFIEYDKLDKNGLEEKMEEEVGEVYDTKSDEFKGEYCRSLKSILDKVVALFKDKLKDYSIKMNALIKDREETHILGDMIEKTHTKLKESQNELDQKLLVGE